MKIRQCKMTLLIMEALKCWWCSTIINDKQQLNESQYRNISLRNEKKEHQVKCLKRTSTKITEQLNIVNEYKISEAINWR